MPMGICRFRFGRLCRRRRCGPVVCFCLCGVVFGLLSLASLAYYFRHQLFDTFVKCSDEDSKRLIEEVCEVYREGLITGSLCKSLCETGEVQFDRCTNFHAGKDVHLMTCTGFCQPRQTVPAVLKSSRINVTTLLKEHPDAILRGDDPKDIVNMLKHQIKQLVKSDLGFLPFTDPDVITVMWEEGFDQYLSDPALANAAYRTVMLLLDQPEYKIMKALKHTGTVPSIYGTCGPMYLEESCPSGPLDVPLTYFSKTNPKPSSSENWQGRVTAAISLLRLLNYFDYHFSEPLHICDAKGSNFGVCADGQVKMIDMDSVFFNTTMFNIFNLSVCKTHEDCNFFDCGGWCNTETGRCYPVKTNNNLQLVCSKVLAGPLPALFDAGGLLSGAPASVAKELHAALQECTAQTSADTDIPMYKPPSVIQRKLITLLQHSIF